METIVSRLIRYVRSGLARCCLSLLGLCVIADAATSAEPAPDSDWYMVATGTCEPQDPRAMLALGKALGVAMSTRDIKEKGKVVATTISAADGSSATYYRGKARCEAVLAREAKAMDRYN